MSLKEASVSPLTMVVTVNDEGCLAKLHSAKQTRDSCVCDDQLKLKQISV